MKMKPLAILLIIGVGLLASFWIWQNKPKKFSGSLEKIRLGVPTVAGSSLLYFAEERNLFKKYGLDASIKHYQSGATAILGLISGEIDVAVASEFVFVRNSFDRKDLRALAAVSMTDSLELIIRKESGVRNPPDLKGKKIATVRGSNLDYFLTTFLTSNGVSLKDVHLIYLQPSETGDALFKGIIDGAATSAPYTFEYKSRLQTEPVTFSLQGVQDNYLLLIATVGSLTSRSSHIERLLKALIDAEDFAQKNEAEAQNIIRDRLKVDQSDIDSMWPKSRFEVRLDQDLLLLMEHEARWAIRNKLTETTQIPDYFGLIFMDGLEKLKPEAVTIIH